MNKIYNAFFCASGIHPLAVGMSMISFFLFTDSCLAFDVQTNIVVQGSIDGKLESTQMTKPIMGADSELHNYSFNIEGRDGITALEHKFNSSPTVSKLNVLSSAETGYPLRVSETANIRFYNSWPYSNEDSVTGISYFTTQMDLSTGLDLEHGLYAVKSVGEGSFMLVLIEKTETIDPEEFEKNLYQLDVSGEFDFTGQYVFIGDSEIIIFPLADAMVK